MKSAKGFRAAFFAVAGAIWSAQAAISIFDFSSAANDRFANSPSFIASDYNLSGVALDGSGKWLAMISPNVYLSAYHYHPAAGTSVTFYASNDPSGASVTRTVSGYAQRIGTSDLYIGTINEPLPSSFVYYDYATYDIANEGQFESSPYYNQVAYLIGRSPTEWPTSQDVAVGQNKLDRWFDSFNVEGTVDDAIGAVYNVGIPAENFVQCEALLQSGDSGGGMFVPSGNSLVLVGINWFIYSGSEQGSGFSYIGNYDNEIRNFLSVYSVPEPGAVGVVSGFLVLGWSIANRVRKSPRHRVKQQRFGE